MIGIVGGTFDPIHYGHLCPVHRLVTELRFENVHYVLSARPPHRQTPQASAAHRYRMLALALAEFPEFTADDREIRRPGPSYTLWTVQELRQQYAGESLCLILGMDAYLGRHSWYRWHEIEFLVNIVVLSRPGWQAEADSDVGDEQALRNTLSGVVMFSDSVEMPITATDVRHKLGRGECVGDAVPAPVLEYIRTNQLYGVK